MPIPAYPSNLPLLLKASKSRSQPASFSIAEPRRGYGYAQAIGTDTPVFWDGQFRFNAAQAVVFQLWFTQIIQRGVLEFTMPIRTEFGLITHTCRLMPDGLADAVEDGGVYTYKVQIMARAQIIPQGYLDAAELIIALDRWQLWAEYLDLAVAAMPEA